MNINEFMTAHDLEGMSLKGISNKRIDKLDQDCGVICIKMKFCFRDDLFLGPISVSRLNATGDVYSAQIMKDMGIADNCAYHVDQGSLGLSV